MEMTEARPDWDAFIPAEETRELASTAREQFAALAPDTVLHGVAGGETAEGLWSTLADSGYTAIGLPEKHDGIGTLVDLVTLLEEAGRALLPAPLATGAAAAQTLVVAGMIPDATLPSALAERLTDGRVFAFDGAQAKTLITVAPLEGRTRVTRIAADVVSLEPTPLDRSRTGAVISGEVVEEKVIGASTDHVLACARICIAADLVGTAARALVGSIDHASSREQFGRVIGSFQSIKHRLADLHVEIERARSLVLGAAVAASEDPLSDETRDLSMLAKAAASEAAEHSAHIHTQLLGAMGLTFEGGSQLEMRRAAHTARHLGSTADLYARVATLRSIAAPDEGTDR